MENFVHEWSRRDFLKIPLAAAALGSGADDLVKNIEQATLRTGRGGGTTWFHPRACMIPGPGPAKALMTLQSITGSDVFGPVHETGSRDLGTTWSAPQPVPGLGRQARGEGIEEGVCDVVPEYHAKSGTVLAIGHNVFYRKGVFFRDQPPRRPIYAVRDGEGKWSAPRKLEWDDPRATAIFTCGCAQRLSLENGEVLVPLSFGPLGRADRSAATVRCAFDGAELRILTCGNELRQAAKRGFLEPSLARLDGRFYMTLRAEDGHGYVTRSEDGLNWAEPIAWAWDDGGPIAMSTTQQRWLAHSEALHLVYTRKSEQNANVFRWRAPLYMAAVDRATLRLVRSTERVVIPLSADGIKEPGRVAHLGNFHTVAADPGESWVTVGETIPADGYRGDLLLARIRWSRPNRLAP